MKKYFLLIFSIVFLYCNKDKLPVIEPPVVEPPITCIQGLETFTMPAVEAPDSSANACANCGIDCQEVHSADIPYDYTFPCFNPNNGEQLAYYKDDNVNGSFGTELWVIDFCTGDRKMLVDNAIYGLDWSVKDWLIYTAVDQNIWKIKSNGDSLTQLTFQGDFNRHPKWSPDGKRIAHNTQTGSFAHFIIADEHGVAIDSLEELWTSGKWSWIDESKICYLVADTNASNTSNMNYYDLNTDEIHFLHSFERGNSQHLLVQNTTFLSSENSILWCALGTIGKTNLSTGEFEIIRETLIHEKFRFLTLSPDEQTFIVNKTSRRYAGNCHVDTEVEFFLFDIDGSNQRRIELED